MFNLSVYVCVITCYHIIFMTVQCNAGRLDCKVFRDPDFNGYVADCSNRKLTQWDLGRLICRGITTLDISHNNITYLPNNALERFKDLKRLLCTQCNLHSIGNYSLIGLSQLEVLHLDHNYLTMMTPAIPPGAFQYLPKLKELNIDNNNMNGFYDSISTGYSKYLDIFGYLPDLTHLSIDSFKNLKIGEEFLIFTKLFSLSIHCQSLRVISNDSLEGFQNSSVKTLELLDGVKDKEMETIGLEVFQYLPNVYSLSVKDIRVGNQNILLLMKPLVGRKILYIKFETVYTSAFTGFSEVVSDTIVTKQDFQYLRDIRVSHFAWYNSGVYCLEYDAPLSRTWQKNIKSIVFETDALTRTSVMLVFQLMLLKELEVLAYLWTVSGVRNRVSDFEEKIEKHLSYDRQDLSLRAHADNVRKYRRNIIVSEAEVDQHNNYFQAFQPNGPRQNEIELAEAIANKSFSLTKRMYKDHKDVLSRTQGGIHNDIISHATYDDTLELRRNTIITPPPRLKTLILDGSYFVKAHSEYTFRRNKITTVEFTNTIGAVDLTATIHGGENATNISFEGSQQLSLRVEFLDQFPSVVNLNLKKTSLTPEFYQDNSDRIVEKLLNLEFLDMSNNRLERLPEDMFLTNKHLKHLIVAGNRLTSIPFNLKFTPRLQVLDLRGNSFVELPAKDRGAIDDHIGLVGNFTVLFGDNQLGCTCSKLEFIAWLYSRRHHFDLNGNYTCISEDGVLSYTGLNDGIAAFWRRCNASYYLMLSIIFAFLLLAAYLALFIGMKKRTEIISKVLRVFVPYLRLKTRGDFQFDVAIGYADKDGDFVRSVLIRYLEEKWHLFTFVHQRDLLQDPSGMTRAIRRSWRCLLLITKEFLYNCDKAHNVMKVAAYSVHASNPHSLVVVVEESVRHKVPDDILQVVEDDNILVVCRLEPNLDLDYETKEFLRTRLM